jgi:hypothetical protein
MAKAPISTRSHSVRSASTNVTCVASMHRPFPAPRGKPAVTAITPKRGEINALLATVYVDPCPSGFKGRVSLHGNAPFTQDPTAIPCTEAVGSVCHTRKSPAERLLSDSELPLAVPSVTTGSEPGSPGSHLGMLGRQPPYLAVYLRDVAPPIPRAWSSGTPSEHL